MQAVPHSSRILDDWLAVDLVAAVRAAAPAVEALVLGGSFARGTEMWLRREDGSLRLLSDLDIYCVLSAGDPVARERIQHCLQILEPPQGARLDAGIVDPGFFMRLEKRLPAHQLTAGHRVLWASEGREPSLSPLEGDVDADDALLLLHNRLAESLEAMLGDEAVPGLALWKLWLDAPLSFLAASGHYHSDRRAQRVQLESLLENAGLRDKFGGYLGRLESMAELSGRPLDLQSIRTLGDDRAPSREASNLQLGLLWCATLRVCVTGENAVAALQWAGRSTVDDAGALARQWLCREKLPRRLRRARHYGPLAPPWISPWWRHAPWGVGPEIVDVALALHSLGRGLKDLLPALGALGLADDPTMLLSSRAGWRQETTG